LLEVFNMMEICQLTSNCLGRDAPSKEKKIRVELKLKKRKEKREDSTLQEKG
jgi:hypothetical protein